MAHNTTTRLGNRTFTVLFLQQQEGVGGGGGRGGYMVPKAPPEMSHDHCTKQSKCQKADAAMRMGNLLRTVPGIRHFHTFCFAGGHLISKCVGIYVAALQHATCCLSLGIFHTLCVFPFSMYRVSGTALPEF